MQSIKPPKQTTMATQIMASLSTLSQDVGVADVRIGLGYTAVMLEDRRAGVAYTFRDKARGGCSVFRGFRPISDRPASDLITLLRSNDPIEAGVGLACANALINGPEDKLLQGDILRHLNLKEEDRVGMVGNFAPLVKTLKERVRSLTVFEKVSELQGEIRPAAEAEEILPNCQVALITATSIINQTIDDLLRLTANCREVAVLGASTPMLPEVFSATNVTLISGVLVKDAKEVLRVVSEGGGMRQFSPFVSKVCRRIAKPMID